MERRPLAVRGTKWANSLAKFLAHINLSPNKISILSVLFSILALICFTYASIYKYLLLFAALAIQLRLICNLLDGMVAIEYNKKSIYGNLYNDIPDRFADVFIIMGAGIYSFQSESQHLTTQLIITLAWINSILAVMTAYIRVLGTSLCTPTNFSGIMAKPQRMALLTISSILAFLISFKSNFPIIALALILMFIGQSITVFSRIKFIVHHLKLNESTGSKK